jgi:uncharacterized protein (TIGR02996 family)
MHAAFLDAVCAEPDSDAPRLVYADWLDDNGQSDRAEFIRLQVRLAGLAEDDPERDELELREWELLVRHGDVWRKELPAWARKEQHSFRRGFVGALSLTAKQFVRSGGKLLRAVPVERVHLRAVGLELPEVAACPHLKPLTGLDVSGNFRPIGAVDLAALLASPHLGDLSGLRLLGCLQDESLAVLLGWPGLQRVKHLALGGNPPLLLEGLRRVFACPGLVGLRRLDLEGMGYGDTILQFVANCPYLGNLKRLSLASCSAGEGGVRLLANSPHLNRLSALDLRRNLCGSETAAALEASPLLSRLSELNVAETGLTSDGLALLITSRQAKHLRRLDLGNAHTLPANNLADSSAVWKNARLEALHTLSLRSSGLDAASVAAIAGSPWAAGLRILDLWDNALGSEAAVALAGSPHLGQLRELDLSVNKLGDEGVQALARSPHLRELRKLMLHANDLTPKSLRALASSRCLDQLRHLGLSGNHDLHRQVGEEKFLESLRSLFRLPRLLLVEGNSYQSAQVLLVRPEEKAG